MINKIVKWLIEQNKEFGTNGFAVYYPFHKLCEKTNLFTEMIYHPYQCNHPEVCFCINCRRDYILDRNLLVVGDYNVIDLNVTRPWQRLEFVADIFPFGNLLPNEVEKIRCELFETKFSILPQTDEDWVWNLTNEQVKFKGILTNPEDPAKHPFWYALTIDQKKIVAKYHQYIKATKIKTIHGKPIFI